jgi:ferredoxin
MGSNGKFTVTLVNKEKNINKTLEIAEDEFILDIADEEGLKLPYSCRAGTCFDCLGKVTAGEVELTEKAIEFLRPEELDAGYVLLCAASPKSDCTILTHQAEVLFGEE